MMTTLRNEYPRPQFMRESWLNLNGPWSFEFDDADKGIKEHWYATKSDFSMTISVPFCVESKLSGLEIKEEHDLVWYKRDFDLEKINPTSDYLLHFGAVDYHSHVWVNNQLAGEHKGGHTPFTLDITHLVKEGSNKIVVRAFDPFKDLSIPRGKQYWKKQSQGIFYTKTTGIWQTVWLEEIHAIHLHHVFMTPDVDENTVHMDYHLHGIKGNEDIRIETLITFEDNLLIKDSFYPTNKEEKRSYFLKDKHYDINDRLWSPENPRLFDVVFNVYVNDELKDSVNSYFGMRKISIEDGKLCLNNHPYYMKLILDQGYFPDGLLTAPSDKALIKDIQLTKDMGFNGARKHQKIEDPRYMYWCDKMGLLVWGEMANAYQFNRSYAESMVNEWQTAVLRDYNHPSVVVWVPLNESWGVPKIATRKVEQDHAASLYYTTKALDPTRPVVSNDGWEHAVTDLTTIHDYNNTEIVYKERYHGTAEDAVKNRPAGKSIHLPRFPYAGQPILLTEFGGISYKKSDWEGWGYGNAAKSDDEFIARYHEAVNSLLTSPTVQGYCYTQLTDVEQEINGLLTYDRQPKVDLSIIKAINKGTYKK